MKLIFPGTRGYIDARTSLHSMHSALLVLFRRKRILIDCGADWLGKFQDLNSDAIFITHAHPDHAGGLIEGTECPVYASKASWNILKRYPIAEKITLRDTIPVSIGGIDFCPFPLVHSFHAPATGYRINTGTKSLFYAPDIVSIIDCHTALSGVSLYIGDGAIVVRSMVRKSEEGVFGHTPIRSQLDWCREEHVHRAIFTHCGTQIVTSDEKEMSAKVAEMGRERDVKAGIAWDGMEVKI
jgi:phosphoribosyl 1,2-cyclic phosphodiesterase